MAAVIFDLDGLLVDSEPLHVEAWKIASERTGHELNPAVLDSMFGRRVIDTASLLCEVFDLPETPEQFMARRDEVFFGLARARLAPSPGADAALHAVRARGLRCALASSGHRTYLEFVLDRCRWRGCFDTVVSGDDVRSGKPAPDTFLEAARRLGIDPPHCVVCEDAPNGLLAAHAAGMLAVAVPNAHTRSLDLSDADVRLTSLLEFPSWLDGALHEPVPTA